MRSATVYALALGIPTVLAQRHFGGGGGPGFFNHGGGNTPNTFITVASTAPAVTPGAGFPAASDPPAAPASTAPAAGGNGGGKSGSSSSAGSSSVDASLIPPYGITAGIKANDGTANCVGDQGKAIPCTCPPSVDTLVSAVQEQVANGLNFPTSNSVADQLTRLSTCTIALQNFVGGLGSGVGCPVVSTTWKELQASLQAQAK